MRRIKLSQNRFAVVDDADYEWLMQWKWSLHLIKGKEYASRSEYNPRRHFAMHREILYRMLGKYPRLSDHQDGNGLNNRRYNLRAATPSQNVCNRSKNRSICTTSQYKGVSFWKNDRKWVAEIRVQNERIFLGSFTDEHDAALTYNRAAKKRFGEFARLNRIRRGK